jgi:hypothetical protein
MAVFKIPWFLVRFASHISRAAANYAIGDEFSVKCRDSVIAEF